MKPLINAVGCAAVDPTHSLLVEFKKKALAVSSSDDGEGGPWLFYDTSLALRISTSWTSQRCVGRVLADDEGVGDDDDLVLWSWRVPLLRREDEGGRCDDGDEASKMEDVFEAKFGDVFSKDVGHFRRMFVTLFALFWCHFLALTRSFYCVLSRAVGCQFILSGSCKHLV